MSLYLDNGYVNIPYCLNFKCPFTFIIGGRATGKTFGTLKTEIENSNIFMLTRRTQAQADLISKPDFSPVNPVLDYMGKFTYVETASKYNSVIYSLETPEAEEKTLLGYTAALSTFSNLRGFDGSGISALIVDEFVPELHERLIRAEADSFFNMYESISRNRELMGKDPLQAILLSNSNSLASPIFTALGLTKTLERMQAKGQSEYINRESGVAIFMLYNSPISSAKSKTALYKATRGTAYYKMALDNSFSYDDMADVQSMPIKSGWKLYIRLGDFYIYRKENMWYMSRHGAGKAAKEYEFTEIGIKKFVHDFPGSYQRIINHRIIYEDFAIKSQFTGIFI